MKVLVTGGAGFIGTNAVDRLLREAHEVVVVDNLSRPGSEENLAWLRERHGNFAFAREDIHNFEALKKVFRAHQPFDGIYHFVAQVAVTTSVENPRTDFETNAPGTLNVLEAMKSGAIICQIYKSR